MRILVSASLGLFYVLLASTPVFAQSSADARFLQLVSAEAGGAVAGPGRAERIPTSMTDARLAHPASHEVGDPVMEGYSQWRMEQPTPVAGHGFAGVSPMNLSTEEPSATVGPRLDTTYWIARDLETGVFLSEHQAVFLGGGTILPLQTPCWVFGVRGMAGYVDNLSMTDDTEGAYSIDAFFGTRYKTLYSKIGFLMDDYEPYRKLGVTVSTLTELPVVGTCTADLAYGFRNQPDEIFVNDRDPVTFRARRVQQCENEMQLRIGKFCSEKCQIGATYNYYDFQNTEDEWGAGGFVSVYLGRFQMTFDLTGGEERLRGYVRVAYSFGAHPCNTARDCRVSDVNAIAWVSRPTDRDQSIRLRESYTGPLPPAP